MKLDVDCTDLTTLVAQMGASLSNWSPDAGSLAPLEALRRELAGGKEIELDEVETTHGGLLSYKGEQVILYIKETRDFPETIKSEPEKTKRFHIFECRTMEGMRRDGRLERYVVTTRRDGMFSVIARDPVTGRDDIELEAKLFVCKNCLNSLNYNKYNDYKKHNKDKIWKEFNIGELLAEYSTFFVHRPKHKDKEVSVGGYVKEWSYISRDYREGKEWICEKCGVNLDSHKNILHTHHKNGVTQDNDDENLVALCIVCHSEQPLHNHLRVGHKDRQLIEELRKKQSN